ncbi:RlpA-like double-psi beta-barrel-containing domain containing protein [Rhypophila sp. PSN 637]
MVSSTFALLASLLTAPLAVNAISGKSYTAWDCCKPACGDNSVAGAYNRLTMIGAPKVCNINNDPLGLSAGLSAAPGCGQGGNAYLCDIYAPVPVSEQLSYGFAIMRDKTSCCKCFELTWKSGTPAAGKKMQVQIINIGGDKTTSSANDLIIYTPGGGVGPVYDGCRQQYGKSWGRTIGGVSSRDECANLPQNLQAGCYWRWNWARGDVNSWGIDYKAIACPKRLEDISGCSA